VIDVERLVRDSALGKEAFNRVKKVNDDKKAEADRLQKDLRDLGAEEARGSRERLSSDGRADRLRSSIPRRRRVDFMSFPGDVPAGMLDQGPEDRSSADLERRVLPGHLHTGSAKERGYTLIFNKFQSGVGLCRRHADITDDVAESASTPPWAVSPGRGGEGSGGGLRRGGRSLRHRRPRKKRRLGHH
jgi:hypothetical protein